MQMPPPMPSAPKRRSNTGLIIAIIAIAVCVPCILFAVFAMNMARQGMGMVGEMANCGIAMEALHKATEKYALAHNGKFPPAQTWQNDLKPYFSLDKDAKEMEEVPMFNFKLPKIEEPLECSAKGKTGIAYNSDLAGQEMSKVANRMTTMLFYEVPTKEMNQAAPYKEQDKASAPDRGFGLKGWVSISVDGESHGFGDGSSDGSTKVKFD